MSPSLPRPSQQTNQEVSQTLQFAPPVHVDLQGDIEQPRQLAEELMPHLHRLFEQFLQQQQRTAWYATAYSE